MNSESISTPNELCNAPLPELVAIHKDGEKQTLVLEEFQKGAVISKPSGERDSHMGKICSADCASSDDHIELEQDNIHSECSEVNNFCGQEEPHEAGFSNSIEQQQQHFVESDKATEEIVAMHVAPGTILSMCDQEAWASDQNTRPGDGSVTDGVALSYDCPPCHAPTSIDAEEALNQMIEPSASDVVCLISSENSDSQPKNQLGDILILGERSNDSTESCTFATKKDTAEEIDTSELHTEKSFTEETSQDCKVERADTNNLESFNLENHHSDEDTKPTSYQKQHLASDMHPETDLNIVHLDGKTSDFKPEKEQFDENSIIKKLDGCESHQTTTIFDCNAALPKEQDCHDDVNFVVSSYDGDTTVILNDSNENETCGSAYQERGQFPSEITNDGNVESKQEISFSDSIREESTNVEEHCCVASEVSKARSLTEQDEKISLTENLESGVSTHAELAFDSNKEMDNEQCCEAERMVDNNHEVSMIVNNLESDDSDLPFIERNSSELPENNLDGDEKLKQSHEEEQAAEAADDGREMVEEKGEGHREAIQSQTILDHSDVPSSPRQKYLCGNKQEQACQWKVEKQEFKAKKESPSVKKLKIPSIFEKGNSTVTLSPTTKKERPVRLWGPVSPEKNRWQSHIGNNIKHVAQEPPITPSSKPNTPCKDSEKKITKPTKINPGKSIAKVEKEVQRTTRRIAKLTLQQQIAQLEAQIENSKHSLLEDDLIKNTCGDGDYLETSETAKQGEKSNGSHRSSKTSLQQQIAQIEAEIEAAKHPPSEDPLAPNGLHPEASSAPITRKDPEAKSDENVVLTGKECVLREEPDKSTETFLNEVDVISTLLGEEVIEIIDDDEEEEGEEEAVPALEQFVSEPNHQTSHEEEKCNTDHVVSVENISSNGHSCLKKEDEQTYTNAHDVECANHNSPTMELECLDSMTDEQGRGPVSTGEESIFSGNVESNLDPPSDGFSNKTIQADVSTSDEHAHTNESQDEVSSPNSPTMDNIDPDERKDSHRSLCCTVSEPVISSVNENTDSNCHDDVEGTIAPKDDSKMMNEKHDPVQNGPSRDDENIESPDASEKRNVVVVKVKRRKSLGQAILSKSFRRTKKEVNNNNNEMDSPLNHSAPCMDTTIMDSPEQPKRIVVKVKRRKSLGQAMRRSFRWRKNESNSSDEKL